MKRTRLAAFGITLLLCLGSVLAQTKVTFWHSQFDETATRALTDLVDRFNEEHSGIVIETVNAGNYGELITRLQAASVSGRLPDVVQLEITRYGLFAERGVLAPLTDLIENDPSFDVDDIIPGMWEAALYKGVPYVLPLNNSVPVMVYNKDHFRAAGLDPENPPADWDELLEAGRTLTVRGSDGSTTQWGMSGPPQWVRNAFVRQNGGSWMNEDLTEMKLNEPEAVEAYQFLHDLIHVEKVAYLEASMDSGGSLARQDFVSGRTSIGFESTGSVAGLQRDVGFDLGVAPLPCRKTCAAPIGGATIAIVANASEETKQAAWTFVSWMTNTENNVFWSTASGYMPVRKSTFQHPKAQEFYKQNPNFLVAVEQFQRAAFARPRPPGMPAIRQLEIRTWEEIATQSKDVERALEDLVREGNIQLSGN